MRWDRIRMGLAAASVGVAACGGDAGTGTAPTVLLSIAGEYSIEKTVLSDGCGGWGGVFVNPGTVRHTPGASAFTLNDHGTRELPGMVDRAGSFLLQPFVGPAGGVPGRDTYETGRFTTTGFTVRVTTVVMYSQGMPPAPDCTLVSQWAATKQGAPNVIP